KTGANDKPEKDIKIISIDIKEYKNGALKDYSFDFNAEIKKIEEEAIKKMAEIQAKNKNRVVSIGDPIAVHYIGTFEDGEKFDSSYDRNEPIVFIVGTGNMIKGFDAGVVGMKIGNKKTLTLAPADAYGEISEENVQEVPKDQMKSFEDAGIEIKPGAKLPTERGIFIIKEVTDDTVIIDVNHPLAGKTLTFEVEMIGFDN
ncbi:MAG: peptidylprolyl isomerase, partial [Candidatus Gracilibacteria bacterium]|nr:peptidylprolyl isomerase [Candidatus Gracilibacteria bacterium]